eukprot:GEMP01001821.1.p1 GENE.GEMP01001821.1~~GEMP01001821.1.p1  ORF type:complete len:423 (+),score=58.66 GEMP01001821.1:187-1455(+)
MACCRDVHAPNCHQPRCQRDIFEGAYCGGCNTSENTSQDLRDFQDDRSGLEEEGTELYPSHLVLMVEAVIEEEEDSAHSYDEYDEYFPKEPEVLFHKPRRTSHASGAPSLAQQHHIGYPEPSRRDQQPRLNLGYPALQGRHIVLRPEPEYAHPKVQPMMSLMASSGQAMESLSHYPTERPHIHSIPSYSSSNYDADPSFCPVTSPTAACTTEEEVSPTLRLRGLPYSAREGDVREFFGYHTRFLRPDNPISFIPNRDGRPSGLAMASFVSQATARIAQRDLDRKMMGSRYIEVFGPLNQSTHRTFKNHGPISELTVLRELRSLLRKKGTMLMSMMGVLLSDEARQFLKSHGIGLKAFFQRCEEEFQVEGKKGEEKVIWSPGFTRDQDSTNAMLFQPISLPNGSLDILFTGSSMENVEWPTCY